MPLEARGWIHPCSQYPAFEGPVSKACGIHKLNERPDHPSLRVLVDPSYHAFLKLLFEPKIQPTNKASTAESATCLQPSGRTHV